MQIAPLARKTLDPVHVPNRLGIQEADFGELGDVGDLDAHFGVLGVHAAEGLGQVEADLVRGVDVADHAVGIVGAGAGEPLAGGDDQVAALLVGEVVLQDVGQDGALGIVGDLAGDQEAELLDGDEDMVREGVRGAVADLPDAGDQGIDIVQDLVGGLVRPLAGVAGAGGRRGDAHDAGIVDEAGGADAGEARIDVLVDDLVAVEADALIQEGLGIAADGAHLLALEDGKTMRPRIDTIARCTPAPDSGVQGGATFLGGGCIV